MFIGKSRNSQFEDVLIYDSADCKGSNPAKGDIGSPSQESFEWFSHPN